MKLSRLRASSRAACLAILFVTAGCGVTAASETSKSTHEVTPPITSVSTPSPPIATSAARSAPIVFRPAGLSSAQKVPLVIALHGAGASPAGMEYLTRMNSVAVQGRFVVAYLGTSDPAHAWAPPSDTTYVHQMIGRLTKTENIDPNRVYVIGFSAGGYEAWRVGCLYSSQVAGIAIVANNMNQQLYDSCRLTRPESEYLLVGGADSIRPKGIPGRLPSAPQTTARWRQLDGCSNSAARPLTRSNITFQAWTSCTDGSAVELTYVGGGLHNWPGGPTISTAADPYSKRYSASQAIWAFLSPHSLSPHTLAGTLLGVLSASSGTRRTITATFALGEAVNVATTLSGRGHTWRFRNTLIHGGPGRQMRITVPTSTAGGRYSIKLTVTDSYGRRLTVSKTVRIPKH